MIVVDDGSSDPGTLQILAKLNTNGVRVIHQQNQGPEAARSAGALAASAPYVLPIDADDLLPEGVLTVFADALDEDPNLVSVWGDVVSLGEWEWRYRMSATIDAWQQSYVNRLPQSFMVRRDALLAVGGWRHVPGMEDWDLWLQLGERGYRGRRLDRVGLRYRLHGERLARRTMRSFAERNAFLRELHPELFGNRARFRDQSPYGRLTKALLPAIDGLPVSAAAKVQLFGLVVDVANHGGLGYPARQVYRRGKRRLRSALMKPSA